MNLKPTTITFGDTVQVRATAVTKEAGFSGLTGKVYEETTPSITGVDVLGELEADFAINVYFEDKQTDAWFSPNLLKFIDHGAGTEIKLDGVDKKWVRAENGE